MNKKRQIAIYIFFDLLAAVASWSCFFLYRKLYIEKTSMGDSVPIQLDENFYKAILLVPLFWLILYAIVGYYKNIYRKARVNELAQTFVTSIIGVTILFFGLLLDDSIPSYIPSYKSYYRLLLGLFSIHFTITFLFRFIVTTITIQKIRNRVIGFNTIIIGSNSKALNLYTQLTSEKKSVGNKFIGFVHIENKNGQTHLLKQSLAHLGEFSDLRNIITTHKIEEVIIAIESAEHDFIGKIINELQGYSNLVIKVIPDMYDILAGSVKMNSILGEPLIQISHHIMPTWQWVIKRAFDFFTSLLVLIVFSPLFILIGIIVKLGSKGSAIYSHYRIGLHGQPFKIYKFRSMYVDAEKDGPALSSKTDSRITPFGKFMRRVRLDEIPQFYNVLIGNMSIVGPRPERQFYIDQIMQKAPHVKHLLKVKPGITSWGQVRYGYAENIDQMVDRLKYDVLYIENMSILVDIKILIYTVLIVIQGRGK